MLHMSGNSLKYGFKWMVLVSFGSKLYIASSVYQKKNIVHDLCFSGHNGVHLWNVYLKSKEKKWNKKNNNKFVDALIELVVRLVGLTSSPLLP